MQSTRRGPGQPGLARPVARPWRHLTTPATGVPALLLAAAVPAHAADAGAASLGPWLFGSLALLLVAAGAHALGSLRTARRHEALLRAAQADHRSLMQLLDAWCWQTDATHCVTHMHPPPGAPAGSPANAGTGGPLWACYEPAQGDAGAGLRERLASQMPLTDLRVRQVGSGTGWLLRAVPRFDDEGSFAGYSGTARPTDAGDERLADQHALQACIEMLPGAALVAVAGPSGGWRLCHANDAALNLPGSAGLTRWEDALARLPEALRDAAAPADGDASAAHEGWHLRRLPLPGGAGRALVIVQTPSAPAPAAADGPSESEALSFTVSHDLRAPIRVVEGFTRILKEDYGRQLDRVGNDHLERVLGAAARMNHMIDALLTLARLSSLPLARQPVNLSQLANYIVDDLRRGAPERTVEIRIEPGLEVTGDPTLLRLVLENLLGNAWKYSARALRAQIVFSAEQQAGRRVFVVRDNGAGFDMRSADRLFGLFQRLHSAADFPGTGVGLASVQRIVRRHGGEIWAQAEPGRGAAFHFTLRA